MAPWSCSQEPVGRESGRLWPNKPDVVAVACSLLPVKCGIFCSMLLVSYGDLQPCVAPGAIWRPFSKFPPPGGALRLVICLGGLVVMTIIYLKFSGDCQKSPGYQNFGAYAFTFEASVSSDYISLSETLLELSCGGNSEAHSRRRKNV